MRSVVADQARFEALRWPPDDIRLHRLRADIAQLPANSRDSLRFLARCPFGTGSFRPCLLALMRDPERDTPIGIQRIGLELRDGRVCKLDRFTLGRTGVVKLWPADAQLAVGEGLETTLAAATRIPYRGASLRPAWSIRRTVR